MPPVSAPAATDRALVRDLAERYAEAANSNENARRIAAWKAHNDLQPGRPLVLISPEGSWVEIAQACERPRCSDPTMERIAWQLWSQLWLWERCRSDGPLQPWFEIPKAIDQSGWGLEAEWTHSTTARGARAFKPVLTCMDDLTRLQRPNIHHDAAESARRLAWHQELLGDLLPIRLVGCKRISFHPLRQLTGWHGLEETMLDMYEEPDLLHTVLAFLRDAHLRLLDQLEAQGLLEHNADNTYHNSGGNGWTDSLPTEPGIPAKLGDMWGSAEAQEMAGVGPAQHREFALAYEIPLLARFGRTGYGCCEDLTDKLDDVLAIPGIRRISMSPWADVPRAAERLGAQAIFSWKPQPAHLVGSFNEDHIRRYLRSAIAACRQHGCVMEIILKDTHTCEGKPERFVRWSEIASEEAKA